jgi:hypothetical protein
MSVRFRSVVDLLTDMLDPVFLTTVEWSTVQTRAHKVTGQVMS